MGREFLLFKKLGQSVVHIGKPCTFIKISLHPQNLFPESSYIIRGHPLKGTCQEKKVVRKQEEAFFLRRKCGCENGPVYSSSEQPPPYRLFCCRSNLLPTLHGSLRFFLTERSSLSRHLNL